MEKHLALILKKIQALLVAFNVLAMTPHEFHHDRNKHI